MQSAPRNLEQALADLIERRDNEPLTSDQRTLLDRMITHLEAEIELRRDRHFDRTLRGHSDTAC